MAIQSSFRHTAGTGLLQALAQEGRYLFSTDQAREVGERLGIGYGFLRKLLSDLEASQWILRIKGGLYATTGELPGNIHVHSFAVATRLVEPSAISHQSALNFHGLTEQVPVMVTASTPKSYVTPSMRQGGKKGPRHAWTVAGVSYEYVRIKPEHFFGVEEVWVDTRFRVPIFDKERTLLDGFIHPAQFGGMGEVLGLMEENAPQLDLKKLVQYALQYDKGAVIKRLGWALAHMGVEETIWSPLKAVPLSSYRLLDASRPRGGAYDKTWMIQNNLTLKGTP